MAKLTTRNRELTMGGPKGVSTDTDADSTDPVVAENDTPTPKTDDQSIDGEAIDEESTDDAATNGKSPRRRVSISVRSLVHGALIVALVATIGAVAWLYWKAQDKLDVQARQSVNYARAENLALNYAANAAAMDFQNLEGWKAKLVAGTTPELKEKLTKAGTSMEQILVPLQWNSTASPLVAKVRSNNGATYVVEAFVSVQTKTMEAPDPLQSTAAYSITIDSSKNWEISDVGGIGAMVGGK